MKGKRVSFWRRVVAFWGILACLAVPHAAAADAAGVPVARDFQADAAQARARRVPILVLVEAKDCVYCRRVLDEFLIPMSRNADYQAKVILRRVTTRSPLVLVDFSGRRVSQAAFVKAHGVKFTPTVLLLGPDGEELVEPLVGLSTPDYYGAFLDQAIDGAREKLTAPAGR